MIEARGDWVPGRIRDCCVAEEETNVQPIIIKKINKVEGGHHGGAWKVAYADFTTAMMAFFMLLWLLNVSDKETLEGLADYFTPSTAAVVSNSGSDGMLAGTSMASEGVQSSGTIAVDIDAPPPSETGQDGAREKSYVQSQEEEWQKNVVTREDAMFSDVADRLRQAIQQMPDLARHQDQLIIEQTPEGMKIQIVDKDKRAMFRTGTAEPYGYAVRLFQTVGRIVESMPNRVAILGHTDAKPLNRVDYGNWELSADRANAARRILRESGVTYDRFADVIGKADTDPLFPDDPVRNENRRISILVLREAPVVPPSLTNR